jgi:hypothetical protein
MQGINRSVVLLFIAAAVSLPGCTGENGAALQGRQPRLVAPEIPQVKEPSPDPNEKTPEPPAEFQELTLPGDNGVWPWPVGAAPSPASALPVSLTHVVTPERRVWSATVNPVAGKGIVMLSEPFVKDKPGLMHALWCDLTTGKVTRQWSFEQLYSPFDLHPDGRQVLVRPHDFTGLGRETLEVWTVSEDGQLQRKAWKPFWGLPGADVPTIHHPETEVQWAAFTGPNHIVTVCANGDLRVWETTASSP